VTAGARARTAIAAANAAGTVTIGQVLDGHVTLDLECLDRVYLNGYVPNLQVSGQVVTFLTRHLGNPVPSPALFNQVGERFRAAVARFATTNQIPVVRFDKGQRKAEVMRPYLDAAKAAGRPGVVAVGVAQEFQRVFAGSPRTPDGPGAPQFTFAKADRRVSCFCFYVWDQEFGPAFIKICAYFPYPMKVWVNGHEWAKQQATRLGTGFTELANGFASTDDPQRLQQVCDRLGPAAIGVFFQRWLARLPLPLGAADRAAGYWWELSMRQVEVSRTLVLDQPRRARAFFDALVADNLGTGRPDEVSLIFDRRIRSDTDSGFATRVITRGVDVTVNVFYKHSRIKQYLKQGRAIRVETVCNSPTTSAASVAWSTWTSCKPERVQPTTACWTLKRAGPGCVLASGSLCAGRTAIHRWRGGMPHRSAALRRSPGHGPGRRPLHPAHPHGRVHPPEPSRPGDRPARAGLHRQPDELRPDPAAPQGPHPPAPEDQHLRPHQRRDPVRAVLHQGPRPAAGPAPGRQRPASPARAARRAPGGRPVGTRLRPPSAPCRLRTLENPQTRNPQGSLRRFRDCARNRWPLTGQLQVAGRRGYPPAMDELSARYGELLQGSYDCVDRIVLNAYFSLGHNPGGFRVWWRRLHNNSEERLDNAHLMRMAGRFSRRVRGFAKAHGIPVIDCGRGDRKHQIAEEYLAAHPVSQGVFLILVARAAATVWEVKPSAKGAIRNLEKKTAYVNHYSFHIVDPEWGHLTIKMSGHPPFGAQVIANGHEYVARQAQTAGIGYTKEGNCFTAVADPQALAQVADTLSQHATVGRLRRVCERWIYSACLCFGLDAEEQARSGFRYAYSVYQAEYSRNLLFRSGAQMDRVFNTLIDRTRSRLDVPVLRTLFGAKKRPGRGEAPTCRPGWQW